MDPTVNQIDTNQPPTEAQAVTADAPPPPSWWLMENVPGVGEKPEWLDNKYKTVLEQAKGYKELSKAFSASGAPERYDLSEFGEFLDLEDENVQQFLGYAKERKLDQDAVYKAVKTFVDYSKAAVPEIDAEAERQRFGKDKLDILSNWAKGNLSEKALGALSKLPPTIDTFEALEELRNMTNNQPLFPNAQQQAQTTSKASTVDDLKAELKQNYDKYMDPKEEKYRQDFDARWARAQGA